MKDAFVAAIHSMTKLAVTFHSKQDGTVCDGCAHRWILDQADVPAIRAIGSTYGTMKAMMGRTY